MSYRYRGTKTLAMEQEQEEPLKAERVFDPAKCGTYKGYKQHQNHKIPQCQPCKDAAAAYKHELAARHKAGLVVREFRSDKCGTLAGYSRHKRHDTPVCEPCREARAEHRANYYAKAAA